MEHPQGVRAGAAIAVLAGILAGLLALIGKPSQGEPVRVEPRRGGCGDCPCCAPCNPGVPADPKSSGVSTSCPCQHALLSWNQGVCGKCQGNCGTATQNTLHTHSWLDVVLPFILVPTCKAVRLVGCRQRAQLP